jgi:peroxiredoxin
MPLKQSLNLPWPITVGDHVPHWSLSSSHGGDVDLASLVGRPLVLSFMPTGDRTAFEQMAAGLRDVHGQLAELGLNLVGIAAVAIDAYISAAAQLGLPYPLLADADGSVTLAHRAVVEHTSPDEQRALVPAPRTPVVDAGLRIVKVYDQPDPISHGRELPEFASAAVIFSCSLLHEASDVPAGRRFVLLSFLYGGKEATEREARRAEMRAAA